MGSKWISAGAFALSIAACHPVTDEEYDDVATHVGALTANAPGGDSEAANDTATAAKGMVPAGLTRSGSGMLTGLRGKLMYTFQLTCSDASGKMLAACDATTDEAHLVLHWNGDIETLRYSATLDRTGDWTLSALTTPTAKFDGTGTFDVDSQFTTIDRSTETTFVFDYDARYDGIEIRMADRALVGGQATYDIHAHRSLAWHTRKFERSFDVHAEVSFDGTGTAQIALDGHRIYRVNLGTGETTLVSKTGPMSP
jgi:hypothetical protein